MKRAIMAGCVLLVIAVVAFFRFGSEDQPLAESELIIAPELYKNGKEIFITPDELKEKLGSKELVILDGSLPKGYAKGHIPGAISIGFKGLSRSSGKPGDLLWGTILPKKELTEKLQSFGVTRNSLIVAYSDTFKGPGSGGRAVWQLRMAGLNNVKLLYGGLPVWKQLGYPLTKDATALTPSEDLVLSDYNEADRATLEYVKEHLGKQVLIDVRSKKEFTGKDTSRGEARAGHIAGAKWMEWTELLKLDGTPKPPNEIVALMAGYGVGVDDDFTLY